MSCDRSSSAQAENFMSTVTEPRRRLREVDLRRSDVPSLHNGDRLSQPEFHRRYAAYPDHTNFELIEGEVHMASPMRMQHAQHDVELSTVLTLYRIGTPGVDVAANPTVILGPRQEPQPDHVVILLPEYGGATSQNDEGYLTGPPETVIEVSHSSVSIDMHRKKDDYRRAGVKEYVVVCLEERAVRWFDLPHDVEIPIPADGILRCRTFPGLWIETVALLSRDTARLVSTLQQGLESPEHAEFVKRLAEVKDAASRPSKPASRASKRKPTARKRRRRNG